MPTTTPVIACGTAELSASLDVQEIPDPLRYPLIAQDRRGRGEVDGHHHTGDDDKHRPIPIGQQPRAQQHRHGQAQRQCDEEHPDGRARFLAEEPATHVGRVDEEQHREDHFGNALGDVPIECVRQPTFDGEAGRHTGEHQEDRGRDPPLLETARQQRPCGEHARHRDE
jgi:hypothetical protein